jgi:hypothetical protein
MKLGGLSEVDVKKISEILESHVIPFSIATDQDMEQFNIISMSNNLRHYSPPNISTHVLAIEINDDDFNFKHQLVVGLSMLLIVMVFKYLL